MNPADLASALLSVVQGAVDPDTYLVFKPLLGDERLAPIIERTLGAKERKMVYATGGSTRTTTVATTRKERQAFVLSDAEILELASWAVTIERHYGKPQDIEWALDQDGKVLLLQSRPETVWAMKDAEAKPVAEPTGSPLSHVMGIFSGGPKK